MVTEIKKSKSYSIILSGFFWIMSIISIVSSLGFFMLNFLSGLCALLAGLIIFPPVSYWFESRKKIKINNWLKGIIFFILFILSSIFLGNSEINSYQNLSQVDLNESYKVSVRNAGFSPYDLETFTIMENQTGKSVEVVAITLFYDDELFKDEYVKLSEDSAEIYKKVFSEHPILYFVAIQFLGKKVDDYGNYEYFVLAKTTMTRDIYNKINWPNFQGSGLSKITTFNYYGANSFYKNIKDLQQSLNSYSYGSDISSSCSEWQSQCNQGLTDSCATLTNAKQVGLC